MQSGGSAGCNFQRASSSGGRGSHTYGRGRLRSSAQALSLKARRLESKGCGFLVGMKQREGVGSRAVVGAFQALTGDAGSLLPARSGNFFGSNAHTPKPALQRSLASRRIGIACGTANVDSRSATLFHSYGTDTIGSQQGPDSPCFFGRVLFGLLLRGRHLFALDDLAVAADCQQIVFVGL